MTLTIGMDLGGTNVRAGLYAGQARLLERMEDSSQARGDPKALLEQLIVIAETLMRSSKQKVEAIGIGVPGIHDAVTGVVHQSPHFPEWKDFPFREELGRRFECPIVTDNDANMWALGESCFGAGAGKAQVLCLTFGTGIGGGVIIGGEIYHGDRGFAGEVGHITIEAQGPPCPCGNRGCWELYASAQGIVRLVAEAAEDADKSVFLSGIDTAQEKVSAAVLGRAADSGDKFARAIWRRFGSLVGIGVTSLVNVLGIHTIIIGGGLSRSWQHFGEAAEIEFRQRCYREFSAITRIEPARLGDEAGIIGAGEQAMRWISATSRKPRHPAS